MSTESAAQASVIALDESRPRATRLLRVPIIGHIAALFRFFADPDASVWGKLFLMAAVAYIVCPIDAIPDVAPVIGWLDDLGVAAVALAYVMRVIKPYRGD